MNCEEYVNSILFFEPLFDLVEEYSRVQRRNEAQVQLTACMLSEELNELSECVAVSRSFYIKRFGNQEGERECFLLAKELITGR